MNKEKLGKNFYKGTITNETLVKTNAILVIKCADLERQVKMQKERIEYLERSNNRREDIISGQRQEISDLEDDKNKLKTINNEYERLNKKNGKGFTITAVQQYNVYELLSFKNYKDNWNKLKEYCEEVISTDNELYGTDLLGKMQELEQGSN